MTNDELIARAKAAVEELANTRMDLALERWCELSSTILAALESRPAPTEERVKAAYDAGLKTLTYYIKSKHDFSIEYMAMGVVQDALRALALKTSTPETQTVDEQD